MRSHETPNVEDRTLINEEFDLEESIEEVLKEAGVETGYDNLQVGDFHDVIVDLGRDVLAVGLDFIDSTEPLGEARKVARDQSMKMVGLTMLALGVNFPDAAEAVLNATCPGARAAAEHNSMSAFASIRSLSDRQNGI
jgi:hypothetical protein